jgi:hypothetical protein
VVPKRRNRQPVQVTQAMLIKKQYEVLSVQEEKFKVEIEKIKLENITRISFVLLFWRTELSAVKYFAI